MTDVMQGLVSEAKKNKFSVIGPELSDEDVTSIWDNVSTFIEKQMVQQKGVNIPGLGIFTLSHKRLDVGNNKYILIQRPVFLLSEKFAQTHGLMYTKYHTTSQIPVVQLNFAALSFDSPFDRDAVESCVKEVLQALSRSVGSKRNAEFSFSGIGRLQIRDSKVKMKFFKEFITSMDGSGRLLECLKDRPGTVDSVMSDRPPTRAHSVNTLVLPRITQGTKGLAPEVDARHMPAISEEHAEEDMQPAEDIQPDSGETDQQNRDVAAAIAAAVAELRDEDNEDAILFDQDNDEDLSKPHWAPSQVSVRSGSRMAIPMAKATGISLTDTLVASPLQTPKGVRGVSAMSNPMPIKRTLSPLCVPNGSQGSPAPATPHGFEYIRSKSVDSINLRKPRLPTPPSEEKPPGTASSCGHANAGQELCYLCHQRARRNVPVSFAEERHQREQEEDKLLQQYQHIRDTEAIFSEQENNLGKRHESQKMAAFNLGVAEAIKTKKHTRDTDFHPSYVFQKRPLTPPRFIKQEQYFQDLSDQVTGVEEVSKKRRSDEEFLERLEQVQLAEDLAAQREEYLKEKASQQEQYKRTLSAQLRYKPLPIPGRWPDSSEPIFGKHDRNNDKMAEKRRRAHEMYKEQLQTVEQRKREAILKRLQEQKEEESMLKRTKEDMLEDRANRYNRMFHNRKQLEDEWTRAVDTKQQHEHEERQCMRSPGLLVHEQCDKYRRCGQCKRRMINCGETNIWCESRYIPGSRLMV